MNAIRQGLEAILLARQQFEGNAEGALDEIEHRAKQLLATIPDSLEPQVEQSG